MKSQSKVVQSRELVLIKSLIYSEFKVQVSKNVFVSYPVLLHDLDDVVSSDWFGSHHDGDVVGDAGGGEHGERHPLDGGQDHRSLRWTRKTGVICPADKEYIHHGTGTYKQFPPIYIFTSSKATKAFYPLLWVVELTRVLVKLWLVPDLSRPQPWAVRWSHWWAAATRCRPYHSLGLWQM